jgi:hypothetical protein
VADSKNEEDSSTNEMRRIQAEMRQFEMKLSKPIE